jgi:hypothetical protein
VKLDLQTIQRIEKLAGRAGNEAFKGRKRYLIAECLRLQEAGGNPERFLAHEELSALGKHFEKAQA